MKYPPIFFVLIFFTLVSCSNSDDDSPTNDTQGIETSDLLIDMTENPFSGDFIGTVAGTSDQGPITFTISSQYPENAMTIDASTGQLSVMLPEAFEYQINPMLSATVEVSDGNSSETAQVTVNLIERTKVYVGSIELKTQAEVDAFGAQRYTEITGYIIIGGLESEGITDLSPLLGLNYIGNYLVISFNENLQNVYGLDGVVKIDTFLQITHNTNLLDIDGLQNLRTIGDPMFLESGHFQIGHNPALANIDGLIGLSELVEDLSLANNDSLQNIDGLSNLVSAGAVWIHDNDDLLNLDGLENLANVDREVHVQENGPLTDFCGLTLAAQNNGIVPEYYHVENNNFNPTLQDLINGNCSL